jgi:hypothetical protein
MAAGWRDLDLAGDAFDLLGSHKLAPTPPRTLFKTVGHASQDLALLLALAERLPAVTA